MKAHERFELYIYIAGLNDVRLVQEYYDCMNDCCGSYADEMEDLCYDTMDISERQEYEAFLREKSNILRHVCEKRGFSLFE